MTAQKWTGAVDGDQLIQPLRPLTPTGRAACPYLGLPDDTSTWMAFPSPTNHCHYVAQPGPVDTVHQQGFCLAESYTFCAVLQIDNPRRLPPGVAAPNGKRSSFSTRALLIVLLLSVAAVAWFALAQPRQDFFERIAAGGPPEPGATESSLAADDSASGAAALLLLETPTLEASPSAEPTATATWTPAPTATGTPEPTVTPAEATAPPAVLSEPSATPTAELPQAIVDVDILNVRAGPGVEYPIVAEAERGRQFDIIGRDGSANWLLVCCFDNQAQGWLFTESVITIGNIGAAPTVVAPPAP